MAKFFNEIAETNEDNKFFSSPNMVNEEVEDDTPSFVSAADAAMMAQQAEQEPEEEEVYSQPTDSQEFSNNGSFQPTNNVTNVVDMEDEDDDDSFQASPMFANVREEYVDENDDEAGQVMDTPVVEVPQNSYVQEEFQQEPSINEEPVVMNNNALEFSPEVIPQPEMQQPVLEEAPVVEEVNEEVKEEEPKEQVEEVSEEKTNEEVNIENSNLFANVETSYVVDNTYKGVDNTGKTGEDIQNPVYIDRFEKNDVNVSGNIIAVLLVLFEVLLSPGKSIIRNTHKYVNGKKAFKVFVNVVIYEFIFSIIGHIIGGCFVDKMTYGEFKKVLDFSNILKLNYLNILISTVVVIFGIVLLITIFNYASSFFSNKGLSLDTYLLIAVLSFFPLVMTINMLVPMLNVMSIYLSIGFVAVAFFYSFMIYINALWNIMEFKSDNGKIFYLLGTFALITIVLVIIIIVFFEDYVNAIKMVFK